MGRSNSLTPAEGPCQPPTNNSEADRHPHQQSARDSSFLPITASAFRLVGAGEQAAAGGVGSHRVFGSSVAPRSGLPGSLRPGGWAPRTGCCRHPRRRRGRSGRSQAVLLQASGTHSKDKGIGLGLPPQSMGACGSPDPRSQGTGASTPELAPPSHTIEVERLNVCDGTVVSQFDPGRP